MSPFVMSFHRVAHFLYRLGIPLLPSVLAWLSRLIFCCYIGPGARIGKRVSLGYGGLGIVIHVDARIGDDVRIGTGVTVGGRSKLKGSAVIGDRCVIGSGAKILGPIKLGAESVIGANAVVVKDVPPRCVVAGVPARVIKRDVDISRYHDGING